MKPATRVSQAEFEAEIGSRDEKTRNELHVEQVSPSHNDARVASSPSRRGARKSVVK